MEVEAVGGGQWPDGVAGAGGEQGAGGGSACGAGTPTGGSAWGSGAPAHLWLTACASLQVHCISTEFTPRKHGGEKGVPFRVQIDTFRQSENGEYTEHLHSASCQIKVFKVGRPPAPRPPPRQPRPGGQDPRAQRRAQWPGARGSCPGSFALAGSWAQLCLARVVGWAQL